MFFLFYSICFTDSIIIGEIPVINSISTIGNISIDLFHEGLKEPIAFLIISNNTKSFEFSITFENNGKFINKDSLYIIPYELEITETGNGILGKGNIPIINKNMLPLINNEFVWQSEQSTATIDYELKIVASWESQSLMSGLYNEKITTTIRSVF